MSAPSRPRRPSLALQTFPQSLARLYRMPRAYWAGCRRATSHARRGRRARRPARSFAEPGGPARTPAAAGMEASFLASLASAHMPKGTSQRARRDRSGTPRRRESSRSAWAPSARPPGAFAPTGAPRQQRALLTPYRLWRGSRAQVLEEEKKNAFYETQPPRFRSRHDGLLACPLARGARFPTETLRHNPKLSSHARTRHYTHGCAHSRHRLRRTPKPP